MDNKKIRIKKRNKGILIVALLLLVQTLCGGTGVALGAPGNELFEPAIPPAQADTREASGPAIMRSSYVKVHFELLLDKSVGEADSPLVLNVFPDIEFSATRERLEFRSEKNYTWFGTLDGIELGHVVLTVVDGDLAGNISFPGGFYEVRPIGSGNFAVYEIDQSAFPDEAPPIEVRPEDLSPEDTPAEDAGPVMREDAPDEVRMPADTEAPADDGTLIDVLVVYTQAAAAASANIRSEIQLAVDETNQAYINSGVSHRVRLAGTAQVTYTETGNSSTDLSRLRGTSDGYMDNVHSLRNSYRADQVTLIVESLDACGRGYFMNPVAASFESSAFTVVDRGCATGYYSFGHELGHNMSAHHDCYVESSLQPYNYNHGLVHIGANQAASWRTIMAYRDQCRANGFSDCQRIQYFSNPSISYLGSPTGTSGSGCKANVRLTLANTDYTVSNFRTGQCAKYGYVERVSASPGSSSSYIYTRGAARNNYYTSFTTSDAKLVNAALKALPGRTWIYIVGNQSCFDDSTDYGGNASYLVVSP